jgi:BirA family biotin operon repressor/biotin-[acetyl-CoA-carboxylase] ligase
MNPLVLSTLRLLADGSFHSGEAMAARLGVTRATVWNLIREAEALGACFEKSRGLGYRMPDPPVWLDARVVAAHLGQVAARFSLEILAETGSTNSVLLDRAAAGAASGTVIAAEAQTAGRGRRGRTWAGALGGSLTFSVLWRFERGAAGLTGLSLVVGLAVARALAALGAADVRVKWPNDILHRERKLGGILIELSGDALGPTAAVIGIGINVRLPDAVRSAIDQPVTDTVAAGAGADRNLLLAAVLRELAAVLDRFVAEGFGALEPEYRRLHALHDRPAVIALADGRRIPGFVRGTADDGALLLETASGLERFHGGEVSVRAAAERAARP